jgi:hypothetical protein
VSAIELVLPKDAAGEDMKIFGLAYDEHHSDAKEFCQVSGARTPSCDGTSPFSYRDHEGEKRVESESLRLAFNPLRPSSVFDSRYLAVSATECPPPEFRPPPP